MTDLASPTLDAIRVRIARVFPAQVRTAVEKLDEEQIWWRPNEKANSVGNLVLHIAGSLNHYLNHLIGGFDYNRDRAAEFAARGPMSKEELLKIFDDMVAKAGESLNKIDPQKLTAPSTDPERNVYLIDDLISILAHLATHAGQIVWAAKMLKEGALDEVWMRTHKRLGGWRQK